MMIAGLNLKSSLPYEIYQKFLLFFFISMFFSLNSKQFELLEPDLNYILLFMI